MLRTVVAIAAELHAHVHVVHVATLEDAGIDPDTDEFDRTEERNLREERARVEQAMTDATIAWQYHENRGDPAVCLARVADDVGALFIGVGASHRSPFRHLFYGSVPKHLMGRQPTPVLVVPHQ
jgi:nucleotide-binding universal stress UspA family protein